MRRPVDLFRFVEQQGKRRPRRSCVDADERTLNRLIVEDQRHRDRSVESGAGRLRQVDRTEPREIRQIAGTKKASGTKWGGVGNSLLLNGGSHATRIAAQSFLINHLGLVWDGKADRQAESKGRWCRPAELRSLYLRLDRSQTRRRASFQSAVGTFRPFSAAIAVSCVPQFDEHGMPVYEVDSKTGKPIACSRSDSSARGSKTAPRQW